MTRLALEAVSFSQQGRTVLHDVSLSCAGGEMVCLMGANGAGKTTLLRVILGLARASLGRIMLDGRDVNDMRRRDLARMMAYVPQSRETPPPYSVGQIVGLGRLPYAGLMQNTHSGEEELRLVQALSALGLEHLRDRPCTALSGGEYQRVLVARAFVQDTPVLILDEPLSGLDFGHQIRVMDLLGSLVRQGRLVIMSAHQPDLVYRHATRVVMFQAGKIMAQGDPALILEAGRLGAFYDVALSQYDVGQSRFFAGEEGP